MSDYMTESAKHEKAESKTNLSCSRQSHLTLWRKTVPNKRLWYTESDTWFKPLARKRSQYGTPYSSSAVAVYWHYRSINPSLRLFPSSLTQAIEASRDLLRLRQNWDENDSCGYSHSTWNRAVKFLLRNALQLSGRHQVQLETPRILPGPDGSIDIHWRTLKRELLINIPANPQEPASYYGDDKEEGTENAIRGKNLNTSTDNVWIFLWLTK